MDIPRIITATAANKSDVEALLDGPGSLSIQLTTNATGEPPATDWATNGMWPQEKVAAVAASGKAAIFDTDLSMATFLGVIAGEGKYRVVEEM